MIVTCNYSELSVLWSPMGLSSYVAVVISEEFSFQLNDVKELKKNQLLFSYVLIQSRTSYDVPNYKLRYETFKWCVHVLIHQSMYTIFLCKQWHRGFVCLLLFPIQYLHMKQFA